MALENGDAVLLVKPAKSAKKPGVLTITRHTFIWKPNDPSSGQPLEIVLSLIQNQQRAKGKAFLRLVTAAKAFVFELESEADVDAVVETLSPLVQLQKPSGEQLSDAARQSDNQAELKRSIIQSNADLHVLYQQLVTSGILSEDEFWKGRASLLKSDSAKTVQRLGLSSAMLTDMQPSSDGKSDTVRVKLTPALVHQIFAEKPHIKRAYQANVPTRMMSHQDFWAKYLKHDLMQRSMRQRLAAGGSVDRAFLQDEEFFTRYQREEDDVACQQTTSGNSVDDLTAEQHDSLLPGYGIAHSARLDHGGNSSDGGRKQLIREINRHAAVVMDGMPATLPADVAEAAVTLATTEQRGALASRDRWDAAARQAYAGSGLDDLRAPSMPKITELRIQDPRQAFEKHGGPDAASPAASQHQHMRKAHEALLNVGSSRLCLTSETSEESILQVALDLVRESEGDAAGLGSPSDALLPQVQSVLRQLTLTSHELLRHFWGCFPASTPQREAKAQRLATALSAQYQRSYDMKEAATGAECQHIAQLLQPVKDAIDAAFAKVDSMKGGAAAAL